MHACCSKLKLLVRALQGRLLEAQQKLKTANAELQELQHSLKTTAHQEQQALGVKARESRKVQQLQVRDYLVQQHAFHLRPSCCTQACSDAVDSPTPCMGTALGIILSCLWYLWVSLGITSAL